MSEHVAIIEPDTRGRFSLRKYLTRKPVAGWKVYVWPDGRRITLEAVES